MKAVTEGQGRDSSDVKLVQGDVTSLPLRPARGNAVTFLEHKRSEDRGCSWLVLPHRLPQAGWLLLIYS